MTINKLASTIAKREGKRSQARIGDIREILKIIATIEAESIVADEDHERGPLFALTEYTNKISDKLYKKKRK